MEIDSHTLAQEVQKVKQIPIIPNLLEVICGTTGMGFAAVARVTKERWIACGVRDEILFGLQPGDELKIETTICNEIRDSRHAVVIEHVNESAEYCNHHTPKMYGFQSYISMPIFLKNGEFFGTLCAIDPHPAKISNTKIIGLFTLFADLISFHIHSLDLVQQSNLAVQGLTKQLQDSQDDNRQYQFISDHNLREPLRKLMIYTDKLLHTATDETKELAAKINNNARQFSAMISDVSRLSQVTDDLYPFTTVDLDKVLKDVVFHLQDLINAKSAVLEIAPMPSIPGISIYFEHLFYHLLKNAIQFARRDIQPLIKVDVRTYDHDEQLQYSPDLDEARQNFLSISITDNGIGIESSELKKIFDIFYSLSYDATSRGFGFGLAYCRKIVQLHRGRIIVKSEPGNGSIFTVLLPVDI